jgi:hypothetical protein
MSVSGNPLASVSNLTAGEGLQKRSAAQLSNSQALFGTDHSGSFQQVLAATQQMASSAPAPVIFDSGLPTAPPPAPPAPAAPAVSSAGSNAQKLGAALTAYARQSISAGAAEANSAARVGSNSANQSV